MSSILVTGATGLIGSCLVEKLSKKNDIRCLLLKNDDTKLLDDLGAEIFYGDITNAKSLKPAVKGVDKVFHLAAAFKKDLPKNASQKFYMKVNVNGTRNVMEACKQSNVGRVVHFSASGVYGHSSDKPISESAPYRPTNPYEISKCEGEKVVLEYIEAGLPVTIIQPTIVYGPREKVAFLRMFKAIKNGTFRVVGDGKNHWHLVYVENLVDGIILASKKKKAVGQKYLIGDEKSHSVNEIVSTVASELGVKAPNTKIPYNVAKLISIPLELAGKIGGFRPPLSRYTVDFLAKNRVYDISKAKKELGYKSKIPLKQGIKITINWYNERGML